MLLELPYPKYREKVQHIRVNALWGAKGEDLDHVYAIKLAHTNKVDYQYLCNMFNHHYIPKGINRSKGSKPVWDTTELFYEFIDSCWNDTEPMNIVYYKATIEIRETLQFIYGE